MLVMCVVLLTLVRNTNRSRWEERQVDYVLHWGGARTRAGGGARAGAEGERV